MDRHGLRPRDDEKGAVIASAARQSMTPPYRRWIATTLRPRDDECAHDRKRSPAISETEKLSKYGYPYFQG
ncbi:MAG: hypothetical protein ABIR56_19685, partial [Polaromonas sp.]